MGAPKAGVWQNLEIPLPEFETLRILHFQGIRKKTKKYFHNFSFSFFFSKNIFQKKIKKKIFLRSLIFDLRNCPKRSETTPNRFRRSLMGLKITFIFSKNLDFSTILQCFRTQNTLSVTLGIGLTKYQNHRAHRKFGSDSS